MRRTFSDLLVLACAELRSIARRVANVDDCALLSCLKGVGRRGRCSMTEGREEGEEEREIAEACHCSGLA